jgi:hypothetical protein
MYLCKQYITTITVSFIIIITVLEAKLINNIKQSNDHNVITEIHTQNGTYILHKKSLKISKGVTRSSKLKDRQHNDQKNKGQKTTYKAYTSN